MNYPALCTASAVLHSNWGRRVDHPLGCGAGGEPGGDCAPGASSRRASNSELRGAQRLRARSLRRLVLEALSTLAIIEGWPAAEHSSRPLRSSEDLQSATPIIRAKAALDLAAAPERAPQKGGRAAIAATTNWAGLPGLTSIARFECWPQFMVYNT